MDPQTRKRLLDEHLEAIRELESLPEADQESSGWPPDGFYLLWHVAFGMMIGSMGALVSLLANAVGAPLFDERPLQLIRVYLTFPMGQQALDADPGLVLSVGAVLYLLTGALYGVLFHLFLTLFMTEASLGRRLLVGSVMGLGLWIVNFYLILSWLQPTLQGDNWIVRLVPWWVGALTHLAFAWTLVLAETWGRFEPDRRRSDTSAEGEQSHA